MNCLDTYALVEIAKGNPAYAGLFEQDFVVADETLAEFFWVNLRDFGMGSAEEWHLKLGPYGRQVSQDLLVRAMKYRYDHRKEDVSFFDCVGYVFAQENGFIFVTGDKEFKDKKGVLFIK
ncbi:MAG TPA: PIN domain-containing protein [Candidatus Nanoarchaeia archaeon]|nr:PIN domain-containing protein [Candidatus Nanoarchaeia archaeon]